jgi:hypothetical protein
VYHLLFRIKCEMFESELQKRLNETLLPIRESLNSALGRSRSVTKFKINIIHLVFLLISAHCLQLMPSPI